MANTIINDALFREIFSKPIYVIDLLQLVLTPEQWESLDPLSLRDRRENFITEHLREKRTDLIFSAKTQGLEIFFIIESKAYRDPNAFIQLLDYQVQILTQTSRMAVPILIYHGKENWHIPGSFQKCKKWAHSSFARSMIDYTPLTINLRQMKTKSFRHLTSAAMLLMLKNAQRFNREVAREFCFIIAKNHETHRRYFWNRALRYLYEMKYGPDRVGLLWEIARETLSKETLMALERIMTLEEMNIITAKRRAKEAEQRIKEAEQRIKEAEQRAEQRGKQEGLEKSKRQTALAMLGDDLDMAQISKYTGLTLEEIKKLTP